MMIICYATPGYSVTPKLVCSFGQFELLCRTNSTILEWIIDFPDSSGVVDPGTWFISSTHPEVQSVVISDSTVLLISRTSLSPLTSLLEINNTIVALNGTRINCTSQDGTESTVVNVVGNGN